MNILVVVCEKAEAEKIEEMLRRIALISGEEQDASEEYCCKVADAEGGMAGYELIRRECPDLVIADVELPELSGLDMLEKIRREQSNVKVIFLAEREDFGQAKRAIDLDVEGYLVKPVREDELRQAVRRADEKLKKKHMTEAVLSIENIFMSCLNGQISPDPFFDRMTKQRFGFTIEEPGAVFAVWLGDGFAEEKKEAKSIIGQAEQFGLGCISRVFEARVWNLLFVVLYRIEDEEKAYTYLEKKIVPKLCRKLKGTVVCIWSETERIVDLPDVLKHMNFMKDWNLLFDRGELIRQEVIDRQKTIPLKYPAEIENQARQAVPAKDSEEIRRSYYRFYDYIRREPHSPGEMKECLIRFNMALLNVYKTQCEVESELEIQRCMQEIAVAMSWREVREAMNRFLSMLKFNAFEKEEDSRLSPLVRKAVQIVRKYYDQGITLEEVAGMLFVSEEYLSSQFKKETGAGFTETVRKYRIDRIKGLLIGTKLKINQIAELTGYADSKYMSRVFKEETGMLPTEFRKTAH